MHEFGGLPLGLNSFWGDVRNPYNAAHITGGSSSGSAAATAAGLVPIAVGTDGGGSIRIPSALSGVVGLKPTHGRVPHPYPYTYILC
jgi:Asp-tRNA(Asn)/Glu-tRNA(Gln) amidotransferase A subunit family amidase